MKYKVGDYVEVFISSQQKWQPGRIISPGYYRDSSGGSSFIRVKRDTRAEGGWLEHNVRHSPPVFIEHKLIILRSSIG